jgi:TatD DNase family protein
MFVDTHTHLYAEAFDGDRHALIRKAIKAGIGRFYMPNIDLSSVEGMMHVSRDFPEHCFPMMGLHPTSVDENYKEVWDEVKKHLAGGGFSAIGEIGIDLYWEKKHKKEQEEIFAEQVELAVTLDLPIVIHTRDSFDETMGVLKSLNKLPKGIFHCFTGNLVQAEQILGLGGFKLGIGGVLTFKNGGLDKVIPDIGLEHLVLETDAPYLAPVPFRGKRNEPAYLLEVAKRLAEIKNVSLFEVEERTTANALAVFGD